MHAVHVRVALQACSIVIAPEGLSLKWEDESKTLQTQIFLKPQVRARTMPPHPRP